MARDLNGKLFVDPELFTSVEGSERVVTRARRLAEADAKKGIIVIAPSSKVRSRNTKVRSTSSER